MSLKKRFNKMYDKLSRSFDKSYADVVTAFEIESVFNMPFPQAGIGAAAVKAFRCVCVQE